MAAKPSRERQAAWRERVRQDREYIAALEAALNDVGRYAMWDWRQKHEQTIARARAARGTAATTTEE